MSKLRVAVLVERPCVSRHARDLIAWLESDPSFRLTGVWYPSRTVTWGRAGGMLGARSRRWMLRLDARLARLGRSGDPGLDLGRVPARVCRLDAPRSWSEQQGGVDLLIRAGGIPDDWTRELAAVCRYGAIGLDFSLSAPPDETGLGLRECHHGLNQAGMVLYALQGDTETAPWVIRRGWFQPHWSLGRTRALLLAAGLRMMKDAVLQCRNWHVSPLGISIRSNPSLHASIHRHVWPAGAQAAHQRGRQRDLPPELNPARLEAVPISAMMAYLARILRRLWQKAWDARRGRTYTWQLGFTYAGNPATVDFAKVRPAGNPGRRFQADPFLVAPHAGGERPVVFVEEWSPRRRRGHISALEVTVLPRRLGQGPELSLRHLGKVIQTEHHLSFPFHFMWEGRHYLCPESANSGCITVWRAEAYPKRWAPAATLMKNVSAVDTMLFEAEGRWWMLTNLDRTGSTLVPANRDFHSELHLFHADHPLSADWTPHPMNPLRIDSYGGRNAGLSVSAEGVFRYGQIQTFDCYGHGMAIYRITALSPTEYREELVRVVSPGLLKGLSGVHGLHTFNQAGGLAVVDLLHRGGLRVHDLAPAGASTQQRRRRVRSARMSA